MLGFPLPYPDELLYSTIARYGIHAGITSPKELLREVFEDTKIIATVDLPGHILLVSKLYPSELQIRPLDLLYNHTLFPLYAPFVGEQRRKRLVDQLVNAPKNSAHVITGIAASRVSRPQHLRYCPKCFEEQEKFYGERYWKREWQVTGVDSCTIHKTALHETSIGFYSDHRNLFQAAALYETEDDPPVKDTWQSGMLAEGVRELLALKASEVPAIEQWGQYYKALAYELGLNRGHQVLHELIANKIQAYWGKYWLESQELGLTHDESCWLKNLFRKHRKAFSYLEHLVVLKALIRSKRDLKGVLLEAIHYKTFVVSKPPSSMTVSKDEIKQKRLTWSLHVELKGVNVSRRSGFGGVYAWLYRNDRSWLMAFNKSHKQSRSAKKFRVRWQNRDRCLVKQLIGIRNQSELELQSPRWSKARFMSQSRKRATLEKHLSLLPLCRLFFDLYTESVSEYQIRRITCTIIELGKNNRALRRWRVLRNSGLSEARLTDLARQFLKEVIRL
ncbi:TnsD family Tn7-like transposition protein [Litoribacillus peritrichatus]|uniref:Transposase n=1 Tax=Litoribacillus peritrichatus TaxID=718191 RepID=A0ABP7MMA3_9GAMM